MFYNMVGKRRAAVINMLATSNSCDTSFDQNHRPGKITPQVSALMIQYLVAVSYEL